MDSEFEHLVDQNNTDELYNNNFELSAWEDVMVVAYASLGFLANLVIIYIIACNARMRNRTNIILMNFAINDALFLISNLRFVSSFMELIGARGHVPYHINCIVNFVDMGFELNESIALLMLMSNTLMKSKRIQVKWLVITIYTFIVCNFFLHLMHCQHGMFPVLYLLSFVLLMFAFGVVLVKVFNNCYKKFYKMDPLSPRTQFRLNIGCIYFGAWLSTYFLYMIPHDSSVRYIWYTIATHSYMSSMYILIYIVYADKNFHICLLNMLRCKDAGDYDVDATITFAEEDSSISSDVTPDHNQVNINFISTENPIQPQRN